MYIYILRIVVFNVRWIAKRIQYWWPLMESSRFRSSCYRGMHIYMCFTFLYRRPPLILILSMLFSFLFLHLRSLGLRLFEFQQKSLERKSPQHLDAWPANKLFLPLGKVMSFLKTCVCTYMIHTHTDKLTHT